MNKATKPERLVVTRVISLAQAQEALERVTVGAGHPLAKHPELRASVTHWLVVDPNSIPMFGDIQLRDLWCAALIANTSVASPPKENFTKISLTTGHVYVDLSEIPYPPPANPSFSFIDLFAGIGGFRLALQDAGGHCVFSSEWDKAAKATYARNFGESPFGDIEQFSGLHLSDDEIRALIPTHDVLAGGFPCQPFSHAGVSARSSLGKKHGFACETQGTLFFNIVRIAKACQPKVLLLENVKNLVRHDKGRTFALIKKTIEEDLGYSFKHMILNSSSLVPQRRERCFIVAFRDKTAFPGVTLEGQALPLSSILDSAVPEKYTISDRLWQGHINRTKRNLDRGVGFTAFLADLTKPSNTLVARYGKDGKECLIPQKDKNPRKLTPRECARLQGFPEDFRLPSSDTPAYKQFGNSVAVPVVRVLVDAIVKKMAEEESLRAKDLDKAA